MGVAKLLRETSATLIVLLGFPVMSPDAFRKQQPTLVTIPSCRELESQRIPVSIKYLAEQFSAT